MSLSWLLSSASRLQSFADGTLLSLSWTLNKNVWNFLISNWWLSSVCLLTMIENRHYKKKKALKMLMNIGIYYLLEIWYCNRQIMNPNIFQYPLLKPFFYMMNSSWLWSFEAFLSQQILIRVEQWSAVWQWLDEKDGLWLEFYFEVHSFLKFRCVVDITFTVRQCV